MLRPQAGCGREQEGGWGSLFGYPHPVLFSITSLAENRSLDPSQLKLPLGQLT